MKKISLWFRKLSQKIRKIPQWFQKVTSPGEIPTSVGTVTELTGSKMIISINGNNYAFPLPTDKRVEVHDRILVDSVSESIIEIIPHQNIAPIGTLYDAERGLPYPFTMDDIAGMDEIKNRIMQEICLPFSDEDHIKMAQKLKITPPSGLLLEGPPGCGKTMLACAIAEYMKLPLLTITSSDVISSLIGESSQNVAKIFRYCREHAPIILFIDEIESLSPKRGQERETGEIDRFYTQLLIELDGINSRNTKKNQIKRNADPNEITKIAEITNTTEITNITENLESNGNSESDDKSLLEKDLVEKPPINSEKSEKEDLKNQLTRELYSDFVFVIGATNRKDLVDLALLRPGRLDIHIKIPVPDDKTREQIIRKLIDDVPNNINFRELAMETNGYSGADLSRLIQMAKISALKKHEMTLTQEHFQEAFQKIKIKNSNSMALIVSEQSPSSNNSSKGEISAKKYLISLFIKHFGKYIS